MRKSQALYYPDVHPSVRWMKSGALLFDEVSSFLPSEAETNIAPELLEFAEATGAWVPYRPTEETGLLVDVPVSRLDRAFGAIASVRKDPKLITAEFSGAHMRFKDHVFVHGSKLSKLVRERLSAHGLMIPKSLTDALSSGDWWCVEEQAADLILASIADRLAAQKGWTSVTDRNGCFLFNSLERAEDSASPNNAEELTAQLLVTELVPDLIEAVPIKTYCELRKRYEPIRVCLAGFLNELVIDNRLKDIGDPQELQRAVEDSTEELRKQVLAIRESSFAGIFKKWGPFGLSSVLTVSAAALVAPQLTIPLTVGSIIVHALDKSGFLEQKVTSRGRMVRLLASLRADVVEASSVKRIFVA